jgi:acyl carrier protein
MAEDTVLEILRNALQGDGEFAPSDATQLGDIPNLDSMARVRIVMEIERVIDDRLSIEEIIALESVGQIRELLAAKGKLQIES